MAREARRASYNLVQTFGSETFRKRFGLNPTLHFYAFLCLQIKKSLSNKVFCKVKSLRPSNFFEKNKKAVLVPPKKETMIFLLFLKISFFNLFLKKSEE